MLDDKDLQKMMEVFPTKVDRHEKWFHQVADKLGIKLGY